MAADKDFVIRNGIEVNENLIYADADTNKVGIGTTNPDKKLVVIGNSEISSSLAVGTTITAQRGDFTGIITSHSGIDIGVGGTVLRTNTDTKKVGINSTIPRYTLDVIGPVSIGQTAEYIYGDLTVTGDIRGSSLSGQISAGGTVGFTNVTVDNTLNANNAEVYTLFRVEEFNSSKFRFTTSGNPVSIGFTQNTDNPEIYLARGQNYKFDVDSGGFPFYIKTQPTADLNHIYDNGVDGNGAQVGVVTFKVPFNAPNILYYQASNTAGMGGTIYVGNDNKTLTVGFLTVTDYLDVNQGDFDNIYVSGIGTINNIKSPNFSVSSGIVTALQFVGVSTGSDRVSVNQKSDNVNYKVTFTEHTGIASNFQYTYIDSESSQLTYNPFTNILSCTRFVGNVSGIATGADNINVDQKNDDASYQVIFSDTNGSAYQRMYIDSDNTHLTYNPSTQTFSVQSILSTNVNATTFTGDLSGTATNANYINVDEKNDNVNYQIVFNDNQGASYQRLYIDDDSGQFVYNPSTRTLTVENISSTNITGTSFTGTNFTGQASNATNLNLQARNDTNAAHYITFGTSTTGNQRLNTDTSLTYNPSTNTLLTDIFDGKVSSKAITEQDSGSAESDDLLLIYDVSENELIKSSIFNAALQGPQGVQGIQGIQGTQGIQGVQGVRGTQGIQGVQGVQGTQGVQGVRGTQGIQGIQGADGTQGIQGIRGIQGVQGIRGIQGVQGVRGTQGIQGIQGVQGVRGTQGIQGIQGTDGTQGIQGVRGIQGTQGTQGTQGVRGIQGIQGVRGVQGVQGVRGEDGDKGTQGIQGVRGVQGVQGVRGVQGVQGVQGVRGVQGVQGVQGDPAITGFDLILGDFDQVTRGNSGASRALVKDQNATLAINFETDFGGGTRMDGPVTGSVFAAARFENGTRVKAKNISSHTFTFAITATIVTITYAKAAIGNQFLVHSGMARDAGVAGAYVVGPGGQGGLDTKNSSAYATYAMSSNINSTIFPINVTDIDKLSIVVHQITGND